MIMSGCYKSKKQSDLTRQAIMIHNSMVKKSNDIQHDLNELSNDSAFSQHWDSLRTAEC